MIIFVGALIVIGSVLVRVVWHFAIRRYSAVAG